MNESSGNQRSSVGAAVGGFAIIGSLLVGVGSIVLTIYTMSERRWEAAAQCMIAAAFAFGFAANAVWRK